MLSPKECLASLPVAAHADRFIGVLGRFERRVLVNYDCIHSDWFSGQFAIRTGLITEVVDVNMAPQTHATSLSGVPYRWIPECFTAAELTTLLPRAGARPLPWAVVAHSTPARAALVDALTRQLSPAGFAFLPPHRPYRQDTGTLTEAGLNRVLSRCDLYVWISHHEYPFHECLRALQAVSNGAVPAKVDPLFSDHFTDLPWVFRDVRSLREQVEAEGLDRLYERCCEFVVRRGSFGEHLRRLFVDGSEGNAAVVAARISPLVGIRATV
jgi:hypothetical protein